MTLSNGSGYYGGGIYSSVPLSITAMRITGNTAGAQGGGIFQGGENAVIADSTINNNTAPAGGAGISFRGDNGTVMRVINSTISNNTGGAIQTASLQGGTSSIVLVNDTIANNTGFHAISSNPQNDGAIAQILLRNTIVADNAPDNFCIYSTVNTISTYLSLGYNLSSGDDGAVLNQPTDLTNKSFIGLAPLAYNGGPTPTRALLKGSAALDAGNNSGSGVLSDQRGFGFARTLDLRSYRLDPAPPRDGTDIGAYESQYDPATDLIFANGFEKP